MRNDRFLGIKLEAGYASKRSSPIVDPVGGNAVRPIALHRAYRTLPLSRANVVLSLLATVLVCCAMLFAAGPLERGIVSVVAGFMAWTGVQVGLGSDLFLNVPLSFVRITMPSHSWIELLEWMLACAIVVAAMQLLRHVVEAPLRYFINFNALVVGSEATYMLFAGHLGYSIDEFSVLMTRTMVATWVLMPLFVGTIALLFPFRRLTGVGLILGCALYEVVLSATRYAAFLGLLSHSGPIMMADLYLVFGPLLDVLPVIGIYSIVLARLSSRIGNSTSGRWEWL